MKLCFSLLSFLFSLTLCVNAQTAKAPANNQPVCIVDGHITDLSSFILNPNKIESVNVLKGDQAVALYGSDAQNGVIIIKTKPSAKLYDLKQLWYKYDIRSSQKKLPVFINKTAIADPAKILIDEDELVNVEITEQGLNIITKTEPETKR